MERETIGVLRDKAVGGEGYRVEWATDSLVPLKKWTDFYIQSPAFKLWGFDARLKIDIKQSQRHGHMVSMIIRLSHLDPRPKGWTKMCENTKTFLKALYYNGVTFDTRKGEGDIKILTTSPNAFQLNFELPLSMETGSPKMRGRFEIKLMIEKPEKEYSLEGTKASLERLHGFRHLSNELGRLLADQEGSDLTIRCGNEEFPVHKFILSSRSTILKKMMGELKEGTLDLDKAIGQSFNTKAVKGVLEWIYTGVMKDKGELLADISALARNWGLEKLKDFSDMFVDMNYRLENLDVDVEIQPPPKKLKNRKKDYNLVFGDLKVIPWMSHRMEWKVYLPKLGDEGIEFRSPAVRFFGVDWSLLLKVKYDTSFIHDFRTVFEISLEPGPNALRDLGFEVGAEPKLKFHVNYCDPEYYYSYECDSDSSDTDFYNMYECNCGECSHHCIRIEQLETNKYIFSERTSILNRLYEKKHEIQIMWKLEMDFKNGLLADKMKKEIIKEEEFLEDLSLNLGNMLDVPEEYDVMLRCKGKDFRAHKVILAAQSPVFKVMLDTPMKESLESVVEVKDGHGELVGQNVVGAMLRWIYTGELGELDEGKTLITLGLAEFYNLKKLKELCEVKLKGLIKEESVVDILLMADFVRAVDLKREAIQFINKNKSIVKTEEFKEKVGWNLFQDIYMASLAK